MEFALSRPIGRIASLPNVIYPSHLWQFFREDWLYCFLLVLATCLLPAVYARVMKQKHCSKRSTKSSASASNTDSFRAILSFSNLLSRIKELFQVSPFFKGAEKSLLYMPPTLTQPLAPRPSPGFDRRMRHQIALPFKLQVRQKASIQQVRQQDIRPIWYDYDFPPLRSPKQEQDFPPLKPQQGVMIQKSPSPKPRKSSKKANYKIPEPLDIPTSSVLSLQADSRTKQPYEAFLVVDIEGTCQRGTGFNYPNEIIEFPVCLLQWVDRSADGKASELKVVDEFRSFVKPTWRPTLSDFCKELTGITQDQVDSAPHFPEVLTQLEAFLVKNELIEEGSKKRLKKFCWCSDGPCDIRDFAVKQCFISKTKMPSWLESDVLDVRATVVQFLSLPPPSSAAPPTPESPPGSAAITFRSLNISAQLRILELPAFEGREHSGIDDTRNVSKVVVELARRGMCLLPNTTVRSNKRWAWMGKDGRILEEAIKM